MKITLDIPDTALGAIFDFVYIADNGDLNMQGHLMDSDVLYDGAEIEIKAYKGEKE